MERFKSKQYTLIITILLLIALISFFCFAALFTSTAYGTFSHSAALNTQIPPSSPPVFIIDAGHGGEDPGAVIGDITEKDINLKISLYLGDILKSMGYKTVYTRTEDKLLYQEGQENKKKRYDLINRVKIASEYENGILISIHINKFSVPKYNGLQVFYSPNTAESGLLAKSIQKKIKYLQPNNNRVCKKTKDIYLLENYKKTGVLIECGFISNPQERENLCNDEYCRKLALTLAAAISEHYSGGNN